MSDFTPGPWYTDDRTVYALQDCLWLGQPSKENRWFAGVQGPKCPENELKANAKLIATAPDLYAALNAVIDECAERNIELSTGSGATDALAKATNSKG